MRLSKMHSFRILELYVPYRHPRGYTSTDCKFCPYKNWTRVFILTALTCPPSTLGLHVSLRQTCLWSFNTIPIFLSQSSIEVLSASRNGFTSYCWDFVSGNVALVLFALLHGYCLLVLSCRTLLNFLAKPGGVLCKKICFRQ